MVPVVIPILILKEINIGHQFVETVVLNQPKSISRDPCSRAVMECFVLDHHEVIVEVGVRAFWVFQF